MRSIATVLVFGLLTIHPLAADDGGIPMTQFIKATAPEIVYEGRTVATTEGIVRLGFPGIVIHLRFRGDSLALRLNAEKPEEYLDIGVDGAEPERVELRQGEGEYPLVVNGGGGEHRVEVTRRTESWQGECDIFGLVLGPNDRLLAPDPLPTRKLMFIGDSMTCGEVADVRPGDPIKDNRMSNGRLTFGKVVARHFNAQCYLVACGGRGLIRNWQGIRAIQTAPQFYELALPEDPESAWDPNKYVPDGIGICIGQNDFSAGVPDQQEFVGAYVQFVEKIRRDAPNAHIFLINSAMQNDWPNQVPIYTVLCRFLQEVAAKIGSPLVTVVQVSHQPGRPGNSHPTGAQHEAIAAELEPAFGRALGW
jgi:hypothetical protein